MLGPQIAQAMSQGAAIDLRMDQMKVRLDPRYGTVSRTQQGFNVQPPAVPSPRDQRDRPNVTTTTVQALLKEYEVAQRVVLTGDVEPEAKEKAEK